MHSHVSVRFEFCSAT